MLDGTGDSGDAGRDRRPPGRLRSIGVTMMLGRVAKAASLLLFGWFVFVVGAVVYAS